MISRRVINEPLRHAQATDIAIAERFEWDYENANEYDLYEACEAIGYWWDERNQAYYGPDSPRHPNNMTAPEQNRRIREAQALDDWNAGKPIKILVKR